MRKLSILVLLLFSAMLLTAPNCRAKEDPSVLYNESIDSEKAIKTGNVVMISFLENPSPKTNNDHEIYNIDRLDAFIHNVNIKKKAAVRIIKFGRNYSGAWVNKLYDLKYNGEKIILISYDVHTSNNCFISTKPSSFSNIIRRDYPQGLWYGVCDYGNGSRDCISLISFLKSSIVSKAQY